jgi:branched-chain amino acid transport system substrate-binding protein
VKRTPRPPRACDYPDAGQPTEEALDRLEAGRGCPAGGRIHDQRPAHVLNEPRHPAAASNAKTLRALTGLLASIVGLLVIACKVGGPIGQPVNVGLIAPLSGDSASSGEAIHRGMLLAVDEVNREGGVLGRPLALAARDVQNDPTAGVAALRELVEHEAIVAVFGGIFSPVMLRQLDAIHELQIPLINPWGSVTAITRNGRYPNYAFRVSVNDGSADEFLVRYALEVTGSRRPGIIADTTAWGDSNAAGLMDRL